MPVSPFDTRGRFTRNYLSFAGRNSKEFLLYLSGPGVYDSPAADVEATAVPGKFTCALSMRTPPIITSASSTATGAFSPCSSIPKAGKFSPGGICSRLPFPAGNAIISRKEAGI